MGPSRVARIHFLFFGISLLFSLFQHRLLTQFMGKAYMASADAAIGVLTGYPHWRVFQNRLLGPYLVRAISGFTSDFLLAYYVFGVAMLTVAGFLAWYLGCRIRNVAFGVLAFFVFQCAFSLVLDENWLYAWDYVDLVVFLVFAIFVVTAKPWTWFVALFAVALLNRESAQFIALWLVVDPLVRKVVAMRRKTGEALDWRPLAAGVACMLFSVWAIEALRQGFLVEEVGFKRFGYPKSIEFGPHFQLKLLPNLGIIVDTFMHPGEPRMYVPVFLLLSCGAIAVLAAVRLSGAFVGLAVLQLGMLVAMVLVAYLPELRVFFQMVPFLVLGITALAAQADAAAPRT